MESVDGNSGDTYSFAMKRAKEVRAKLDPRFPSFLKLMLRSHVSGGFWLVSVFKYQQNTHFT